VEKWVGEPYEALLELPAFMVIAVLWVVGAVLEVAGAWHSMCPGRCWFGCWRRSSRRSRHSLALMHPSARNKNSRNFVAPAL
jgi:hypothetical protein